MSFEIEYDDALNEAGWKLVELMQGIDSLSGKHFNNIKPCLKKAIETYIVKSDLYVECIECSPTTDREKMLVEALLRKCRGLPVEVNNSLFDCYHIDTEEHIVDVGRRYKVPPTKADLILEEITKNMDESAAQVVKEAMELSPTLKGLCDE